MNFMIDILRGLTIGSRKHAEEDELLRLLDGELGTWQAARVLRHIEQCWTCRSRYEAVQGTILEFVELRKRLIGRHLPLSDSARNGFLRTLQAIRHEAEPSWSARVVHFRRRASPIMRTPAFVISLIAIAVWVGTLSVWERNVPRVSASEFLDRAQIWDNSGPNSAAPGVVRQHIQIRTPTLKFDHSLYRDPEGRRRPRSSPVVFKQAAL